MQPLHPARAGMIEVPAFRSSQSEPPRLFFRRRVDEVEFWMLPR